MLEFFEKMYNYIFRDPSSITSGGVILGLFLLSVLCLIASIRGKSKVIVNNWFLFFLFIIFAVLGVAYATKINNIF